MTPTKSKQIISSLANGIDPETGELPIKGAGVELKIWPFFGWSCEEQGKPASQTFAVNRGETAKTKIGRVLPAVVLPLPNSNQWRLTSFKARLKAFRSFAAKN